VPKPANIVAGSDAVRQSHADEEAEILDRENKQKNLEGDYEEAAGAQVRDQARELQAALQGPKDLEDVIALQNRVDELLAMQAEEKTPHADELLEKTSQLRYSFGAADQLKQTRRMIQTKAKELSVVGSPKSPSSSVPADAAGKPQVEKDPFE
jgi:rubrerythrin